MTNKLPKEVQMMGTGGGFSYSLDSCGCCSCSRSCSDNESTTWLTSPTRKVKDWAKGGAIRRPGNSNFQQLPLNDSYWLWLLPDYAWDGEAFTDCSKKTFVTSTWTWVCEIHIISVDLQNPPLHVAGIPFTEKQKWKWVKLTFTFKTQGWFSNQERDRKYYYTYSWHSLHWVFQRWCSGSHTFWIFDFLTFLLLFSALKEFLNNYGIMVEIWPRLNWSTGCCSWEFDGGSSIAPTILSSVQFKKKSLQKSTLSSVH